MPDKSNPFSAWSAGDQANIRQQLLDQLHTGQLNPAQRTAVLDALVRSNPQAGTSTFSLATGVPLTIGGIAGALASGVGKGLWDLAQGYLGLADPNLTPLEKTLMKYSGSRHPLLSPVVPERMVKGVAQGLGELPKVPAAMRDIFESGPTGLAAAAITEGPRLGGQVAGAELLGRGAGMVSKAIPSEVRAGRGFDYVEGRIGNQPLRTGASQNAALDLYNRIQLTGRISVPQSLSRFLDQATSPGGISFLDARRFYTDFRSFIEDRDMPSVFQGKFTKLAGELGEDLKATARQYGLGNIYEASLREFSKAKKYGGRVQAAARPIGGLVGGGLGYESNVPHAGWVGAGLGYKYGPQVAGALADLALKRTSRGLPGVPISSTIPRALSYGGATLGAGRSLPSSGLPATTQSIPVPPGQPVSPQTDRRRQELPAEFRNQPVIQLPPQAIAQVVDQSARDTGLDSRLIQAMRGQESGDDPGAISPKTAMGDMQLMPDTARTLKVKNPFDPRENIPAGARYMRDMLARYKGNIALALAAYNAGSKAVDKYGGIPPFKETQDYVRLIMARYRQALMGPRGQAAATTPSAIGPAFGIPGQPPPPLMAGHD